MGDVARGWSEYSRSFQALQPTYTGPVQFSKSNSVCQEKMFRYVRFDGLVCRVLCSRGVSAPDSGARGVFGVSAGLDCRGLQHCNRPTVGG